MKVLVLGGTGSIGSAVVRVLIERSHEVFALGRSERSRRSLADAGALPLAGDIREPVAWIASTSRVDAVVHAAATWDDDMGTSDTRLAAALLETLGKQYERTRLLYTGGCWLYGATGDSVATEETPYRPPAGFEWAIPTVERIITAPNIHGMVIHPAMVWEVGGGVFDGFYEDASSLGRVRVIGSLDTRWPLVHREDLAELYALMLERGRPGDVFNAAAEPGVRAGDIAQAVAECRGVATDLEIRDIADVVAELGAWAAGYAIDQQMSGQRAMDRLGWRPRHTDAIAGVRDGVRDHL